MTTRTKLAWVAVLYFAEGFPYGLVFDTYTTYFAASGVSLRAIGLVSLLSLPWTLKFLWAPAVDLWGERRHWFAACQLLVGVSLLANLVIPEGTVGPAVWALLFATAFLGATQDVAIDAYTIELVDQREMGPANGVRQTAYRVAIVTAGGLLVWLAGAAGWRAAFTAGAGLLALSATASLAVPRLARAEARAESRPLTGVLVLAGLLAAAAVPFGAVPLLAAFPALAGALARVVVYVPVLLPIVVATGIAAAVVSRPSRGGSGAAARLDDTVLVPFRLFVTRHGLVSFLGVLGFVLLFRIGEYAIGPMVRPFWLQGRGFSLEELGFVVGVLGPIWTVLGALLAGWLTTRWGIFRALWILGLFQGASNLAYAVVGVLPLELRWPMYVASGVESFCSGLGTTPLMAFLMTICDKGRAATQFALLTALFNLTGLIARSGSGILTEQMGFVPYFVATFVVSFSAYVFLPAVRRWAPKGDGRQAEA